MNLPKVGGQPEVCSSVRAHALTDVRGKPGGLQLPLVLGFLRRGVVAGGFRIHAALRERELVLRPGVEHVAARVEARLRYIPRLRVADVEEVRVLPTIGVLTGKSRACVEGVRAHSVLGRRAVPAPIGLELPLRDARARAAERARSGLL